LLEPFRAFDRAKRNRIRNDAVREGLLEIAPEVDLEPNTEVAEAPEEEYSLKEIEEPYDLEPYWPDDPFDYDPWDSWDYMTGYYETEPYYWPALSLQDELALFEDYTLEPEHDFGLAPAQAKPGVERHWHRRYQKKGINRRRDTSDSPNRKRRRQRWYDGPSERLIRDVARNPVEEDWIDEFTSGIGQWKQDEDLIEEIRNFATTQDADFGKHRAPEPEQLDEEPDDIDSSDFDDPASKLKAYTALMCSLPGETEPSVAAWYERWDDRDGNPDELITGTTEPYLPALSVC
jgi:hypothetical protein